jgi:hypothetical protein
MVEKVIDGVKYVIGTYNYGKDAEINDKIMSVDFDVKTKTPVPVVKAGLQKLLVLLASLKSWTFRGVDDNGEVMIREDKPILPISEENVRLLPKRHGDELSKIANKLNGFDEDDSKNLPA